MRRSRSLTSIPMPISSRRDPKSQRAKSNVRNSREPSLDRQTLSAHKYGTPLAYRKNITPTSYSTYKRSGSVSSFGSRGSLSSNRSPLEKISMQKLVNDKKWVAEQYSKVQKYIQTSGIFNPELSGMIRPPTINTVVEIMSCLFRPLIKTDPINTQNYADVVLRTLKTLNYPGSLTMSTIKTTNTMHGWPHFISIVSWLIERVDLRSVNDALREQQDEDVKQKLMLDDSIFEFLTTQHGLYAGGGTADTELLLGSEKKLFHDLSTLTGTNHEAIQSLQQPIESCRAEAAELEAQLEEINNEILKLQAENAERQKIIKNFKESNTTKEEYLEVELSQLRKLVHKQAENKKNLVLSVKELENIVASQSCRYKEKAKILGQIEDLKRATARKERKITEYNVVRDELDRELKNMVSKIESKVDAWNVSLTKTLLPEMQKLRLREKGFCTIDFLYELKKTLQEKEELQMPLLNEFKTIKFDIEKLQKERESFIRNNRALEETKEKLDSLKNSIKSLTEENLNLLFEIEEVDKRIDTDIIEEDYLTGNKIKEAETEIYEYENRIQKLTEEIDKSAKKGLSILVEAHNMAMKNIQTIDVVMHSMLNDVTDNAEESKRNLAGIYDYILSIQEKSASLFENLNEDNKENINKN